MRLNVESGSNAEALQAHVSAIADALGGRGLKAADNLRLWAGKVRVLRVQ